MSKAVELSQLGELLTANSTTIELSGDLQVDGTISTTGGYENIVTSFTIFGRSINTPIAITNGVFTVVGRSANTDIGIS